MILSNKKQGLPVTRESYHYKCKKLTRNWARDKNSANATATRKAKGEKTPPPWRFHQLSLQQSSEFTWPRNHSVLWGSTARSCSTDTAQKLLFISMSQSAAGNGVSVFTSLGNRSGNMVQVVVKPKPISKKVNGQLSLKHLQAPSALPAYIDNTTHPKCSHRGNV